MKKSPSFLALYLFLVATAILLRPVAGYFLDRINHSERVELTKGDNYQICNLGSSLYVTDITTGQTKRLSAFFNESLFIVTKDESGTILTTTDKGNFEVGYLDSRQYRGKYQIMIDAPQRFWIEPPSCITISPKTSES